MIRLSIGMYKHLLPVMKNNTLDIGTFLNSLVWHKSLLDVSFWAAIMSGQRTMTKEVVCRWGGIALIRPVPSFIVKISWEEIMFYFWYYVSVIKYRLLSVSVFSVSITQLFINIFRPGIPNAGITHFFQSWFHFRLKNMYSISMLKSNTYTLRAIC